jgi:acyl carrier protein
VAPAIAASLASPPAAPKKAGGGLKLERAELEKFLVSFVVEQTGYPEEMVELDADLEADLGIDSIKKAQMVAELADQMDVQVEINEDLTLDDFPTLRHVVDFLERAAVGGSTASPTSVGT